MNENPPLLIEVEDLASWAKKENVRIVDLCSRQNRLCGHIPGALHVEPQLLVLGQRPTPGLLPPEERLESLFGQLGMTPDTHFIAYDDEGGGWAGRFLWTLDIIGHKRASYLNGGLLAWRQSGRELEHGDSAVAATDVSIHIDHSQIVQREEILAGLDKGGMTVWDARSPEEYRGEKVVAARGGHIPGAINCEWTSLMDPAQGFRIRQDAEAYLASLGLRRDQNIVTHCQSHHRSAFTWLVGRHLDFNIRAYPGSWAEWGNLSDTPVES